MAYVGGFICSNICTTDPNTHLYLSQPRPSSVVALNMACVHNSPSASPRNEYERHSKTQTRSMTWPQSRYQSYAQGLGSTAQPSPQWKLWAIRIQQRIKVGHAGKRIIGIAAHHESADINSPDREYRHVHVFIREKKAVIP